MIKNSDYITKKCGDVDCLDYFKVTYKLRNKIKLCSKCGDLNVRSRRYKRDLKLKKNFLVIC